jgi:DNA-binding MarR family transcriptional regulator
MSLTTSNSSQLHHLVSLMSRESDLLLQEQLGIGLAQYKILTTLHEHPKVQQKVIAGVLGQTEASISRQIKLLYQKGLLISPRNPENQRAHIACLTPKGMQLITAAEKVLGSYHSTYFTGLSAKQQQQLDGILTALHNSVCLISHPA